MPSGPNAILPPSWYFAPGNTVHDDFAVGEGVIADGEALNPVYRSAFFFSRYVEVYFLLLVEFRVECDAEQTAFAGRVHAVYRYGCSVAVFCYFAEGAVAFGDIEVPVGANAMSHGTVRLSAIIV